MDPTESIEMQYRDKPANVSLQDANSEEEHSSKVNNTETSSAPLRQLDVSYHQTGTAYALLIPWTEIHQFLTHCGVQCQHSSLLGSFSSIFHCWTAEWRTSMSSTYHTTDCFMQLLTNMAITDFSRLWYPPLLVWQLCRRRVNGRNGFDQPYRWRPISLVRNVRT